MGLLGFRNDPVQICDTQRYSGALADRWGTIRKARRSNAAKLLKYLLRERIQSRASPSSATVLVTVKGRRAANYSGIPEQLADNVLHYSHNLHYLPKRNH